MTRDARQDAARPSGSRESVATHQGAGRADVPDSYSLSREVGQRGHRLAGQAGVRMSDLEGETLPRGKGIPAGDGTGPEVADVVQMAHMIALGRMIAVLPRSLVEPAPAGLACVPVTDAPPSRLVLAWNEYDRRPLVASFVAAALASSRAGEASTLRAEQRV